MKKPNVTMLGATGAVGREMIKILEERSFPIGELRCLASARSVGKKLPFAGREIMVEEATDAAFTDADIVLGAAENDIARRFAPAIKATGAVFIDNSSAFRMDEDVPLVVPEINPEDALHHHGIIANPNCSTIITLVFGFILTKIGYANIWPLFGSANQLLSALVLATLCVFLKVTGRSNKMLFPPLVIMLCVTFTALVQRLIAMVKAISTAASVTIPAGETTWGAVFIANGLQLILAVLLIVLGLNIVFHSFKAYKNAEHNSEAKA